MAHVADHLSVSALEQQYRSCTDVRRRGTFRPSGFWPKGSRLLRCRPTVSFARRWVEIPWARLVAPCSLAE